MNVSTPAASGKPQVLTVSPAPSDVEYHLSSLTDDPRRVSPSEFETALHDRHWDVIVCDFNTASAQHVMALVKANAPNTPVIFVAESATVPDAVVMMRLGARGFVDRADPEQLVALVKQELAEQATLVDEESFHSEILRNMAEGVHIVRASDGIIVFANRTMERLFGYAPGEVVGQHVSTLYDPAAGDPQRTTEHIIHMLRENGTWSGELQRIRKDGTPFWSSNHIITYDHAQFGLVWITVQQDITAQKQAQDALRASEERYRHIVDTQSEWVCRYDTDLRVKYGNPAYCRSFGTTPDALIGQSILNKIPAEKHAQIWAYIHSITPENPVAVSIHPTIMPDGSQRWVEWKDRAILDEQGQIIEYQGVGRDITEQRLAEEALRQSEERFRYLFKNHPHPMWVYDRETLAFLEVNDAAIDHYGYSHEEFLAMRLPDIRPSEDVARLLDDTHHMRPDLQHSGEWRHTLKNGRVIPVEITSHTLEFAGRPAALVVAQDITERKNAQVALEAAHALLEQRVIERTNELERAKNRIEAIFNHSGDGILLVDVEFGIQQGNYAFDQLFGVPTDSYVGWTLGTLFAAEDATTIDAMVQEVATTHQTRHVEARFKRQDDQIGEVEISIAPVNRSENKVVNLVCIIRDITERKQAQAALQKYAAEVHDLYDFAPVGYHSLDKNGVIVRINHTELKWLGYTELEVVNKLKITDILTPASQQAFYQSFAVFVSQGYIHDAEIEIIRKDGSTFWVLVSATAVYNEQGEFQYSRSTLTDITELRQAQRAIAEERNLLRAVIDAVPDYIYVKDNQHRMVLNNVAHARTLGVSGPAEAVGKTDFDMFPLELAAKYHADEARIFATGDPIIQTEERSRGQDGQEIWALTTKLLLRNLDGAVIGLVGTTHDISHLKASEAALRRSQADLRSILDSTSTAFMLLDRDGVVRLVNRLAGQAAESIFDKSLGVGQSAVEYIPPQYHAPFKKSFAEALQGKAITAELSIMVGETSSSLEFRYYPVRTGDGEIIGVTIAMDDITERKAAEQQLRYLASLQEHMYDAVIGTDLDFRIQSWNAAAERIYGWTAAEAIGKDTSEILRTEIVTGEPVSEIRHLLADSGHWNGEVIHRHRDGNPLYILESVAIMRDKNDKPTGIIAVAHNITARKLAEQELERKYQHERVMQGYLTALHDISLRLTRVETLDEFYRLAVQEGLAQFGFERMGLLLYNADDGSVTGTYGTDAEGQVVAEHYLRMDPSSLTGILRRSMDSHERFRFEQETTLYAYFKPIGRGQNAVAALWNGQVLGWLAIDNGVHHQPITQAQLDILALYAMTVGSLMTRKRAEIALRESEERYRFLAENVQDVILRFSPDLIRTYATPSTYAMLGYLAEELIGQPMFFLMHPDDIAATRSKLQHALSTNAVFFSVTCRVLHKAGHYVWVEVNTTIVRDFETGRVIELISLIHDITERKQAEDALRESEERFRLFVESAPLATLISDYDGKIVLINEAGEKLLGYQRNELVGQQVEVLVPEEFRVSHQHHRDRYEKNPVGRRHKALQLPARRKDGSVIQTEIQLRQIDTQPTPLVMSLLIDLTERLEAEQALKQALAHEKELGDLKSRFVSMASHEFRTPLAAIMATTETLTLYRDKISSEQIDARLDKIRQQVNHMKGLIEEVLELAQIQAGRIRFKPSISHFDALCEEIVEEFDSQAGYRGRIVYTCDQPPVEALFDRRLARQIISNLVSNALKYSPETKPVYIQLRNEADQLVLTVADEGIGIPPEDLKHLFEPFHRAANVGTISGTGLGLSITKQAVDLHGGTIIPASVEGQGTTFTVTLPKLDQGKVGHGEDSRH
ncbi:MAG: hypothetical protein BroJett018_53460 [Chloroflexota bacterium]|nr:MAG: hypothetical protein BroJett018_53460 [Chloroflexota bacterium]